MKGSSWGRRKKQRKAKLAADQFGRRADYVRGFPCLISGCNQRPIHAAHVKSRATGGVAKNNLVPLCVHHHAEQHAGGLQSFQTKYSLDLNAEAKRIEGLFREAYRNLEGNDLAF